MAITPTSGLLKLPRRISMSFDRNHFLVLHRCPNVFHLPKLRCHSSDHTFLIDFRSLPQSCPIMALTWLAETHDHSRPKINNFEM